MGKIPGRRGEKFSRPDHSWAKSIVIKPGTARGWLVLFIV